MKKNNVSNKGTSNSTKKLWTTPPSRLKLQLYNKKEMFMSKTILLHDH